MKILAVDTATRSCSVAVLDDRIVLAELTLNIKQTHSKHLMGMIQRAADLSGVSVSDIDGFSVTRGPGSFTGLRIGISTVKGLADALGKPIAGVSTLDALALPFCFSTMPVCSLLDAGKEEVYVSCYRFEDNRLKTKSHEQVLAPEAAVDGLAGPCLLVGDGALKYKHVFARRLGESSVFAPLDQNMIRACHVARLGMQRLTDNDTDDIEAFIPRYIRKSDAELKKESL